MSDLANIQNAIIADLVEAGAVSAYKADANEPDPRYRSYGVRAKQKQAIFKRHRPAIQQLAAAEQIKLGTRLIKSGFGEQQSVGLWVLEPHVGFFTPSQFGLLDELVRCLHGWSKVDEFAGSLLREVLFAHTDPFLELVEHWNRDADPWPRRTSVVIFTRKVAKSGKFLSPALKFCDQIKFAPEDLVRKGIGWALKDLMRAHKTEVLAFILDLRRQNVSKVITTYAIRDLKGDERANFVSTLNAI